MAISISGEAGSEMATSVIADAVETWLEAKKRSRLPKKTHQTGEENAANENVSQTVDACVQTDRDMLKEIVKKKC